MIRRDETFNPTPDLPGEGWRLNQLPVTSDLINPPYVMKPPQKPQRTLFRQWFGEQVEVL